MKYEIGQYGLTLEKTNSWAADTPIHYLWYVEESASGVIYEGYEEAVEKVKEKMRSDKESGRQAKWLEQGHIIIYFTAGWEGQNIWMKMHISDAYDEKVLDVVHAYDDRIIVEKV